MMPASSAQWRPRMSRKYSPSDDFGAPRIGKYRKIVFTILLASKASPIMMYGWMFGQLTADEMSR